MTDTTPSPPDILTRLREHARSLILFGISPEPQLLLDAAAGLTRMEAKSAFCLSLGRHGRIIGDEIWELLTIVIRHTEVWVKCEAFDECALIAQYSFNS